MMRHVSLLTREELIRGQAFQSLSCHPVFTLRAALKILWELCSGQRLFHLRQVIRRQFFFWIANSVKGAHIELFRGNCKGNYIFGGVLVSCVRF